MVNIRKNLSKILLGIVCTVIFWSATAVQSDAAASKKILIIHSDEEFIPANIEINKFTVEALKKDLKVPVTFYSEYLDRLRYNSDEAYARFEAELIERYDQLKPDLMIAVDYKAYLFASSRLNSGKASTPIVFCMLPRSTFDAVKQPANVTGNFMNIDIIGTLDLIEQLQPDVTSVSIIAGSGSSDLSKIKEVKERLNSHSSYDFQIAFITDKSMSEFEAYAATREKNEALVYLSIFEDKLGQPFIPREALAKLDQVTTVPIYGLFYTNMDSGLVGGSLFEFKQVSLDAAERTVAILNGQPPDSLPLTYVANNTYINYPMLKRWHLPEKLVPSDVSYHNQILSPWQLYQREIIAILIVMLLFIGLIVVLLAQLRLKKRAESALKALNSQLEDLVDERTADLTLRNLELQEAHQRLNLSEKQLLIQNLSRNLLHKINTPLGVSISYIDLLSALAQTGMDQLDLKDIQGDEGILSRLMSNQLKIKAIMESLERTLHIEQQTERTLIQLEEVMKMAAMDKRGMEVIPEEVILIDYPSCKLALNDKGFIAAIQCLTDYSQIVKQSNPALEASELKLMVEHNELVILFHSPSFGALEDLNSIFEPYSLLPFKSDDSGLELTIFSNLITLGLAGTIAFVEQQDDKGQIRVAIRATIPVERVESHQGGAL